MRLVLWGWRGRELSQPGAVKKEWTQKSDDWSLNLALNLAKAFFILEFNVSICKMAR